MTKENTLNHLFRFILLSFLFSSCSGITGVRAFPNDTQTIAQISQTPSRMVTPVQSPVLATETPSLYPTPETIPVTDVVEINWEEYGQTSQYQVFFQHEWVSNTLARLATFNDGSNDGDVTVDITEGKDAKAKASFQLDRRNFSPHKTYFIECGDRMKMFRASDSALISEASPLITIPSEWQACSNIVQWSPNESHASFVDADNTIYIWPTDGTAPRQVAKNASSVYTNWAPNSLELALVKSFSTNVTGTAVVLDTNGKVLHEFDFKAGSIAKLSWLTDTILVSGTNYTHWYYDIQTGRQLFEWRNMPVGNGIWHQYPQASPDGKWIFIDQGMQSKSTKEYILYDVLKQTRILLLNQKGNYLAYKGWNSDNSKMYLINRPGEAFSIDAPSTPFGLLAYDVEKQTFDLIIKDAVQIEWNPEKSRAFIVYAERDGQKISGLAGSLWDPATNTLIGKWHVSEKMYYQDPAEDQIQYNQPGPISVNWSHNGQKVVINNGYGQVKLLDMNGKELPFIDGKNKEAFYGAFLWSPDDHNLLIANDYRAWIVNISN